MRNFKNISEIKEILTNMLVEGDGKIVSKDTEHAGASIYIFVP